MVIMDALKKMEYADPELAAGDEPFYYRVRWPPERSPLIRGQLHRITHKLEFFNYFLYFGNTNGYSTRQL